MDESILEKIEDIKRRYGENPQCYLVALILASNFAGEVWYNSNHCVTLIGEKFYDKKGVISVSDFEKGDYLPIYEFGIDQEAALLTALMEKHPIATDI